MEHEGKKEWKCPPHFWIVDEKDIGHCKYCPAVKDFGKELEVWVARHENAARELSTIGGERRRGRPRNYD